MRPLASAINPSNKVVNPPVKIQNKDKTIPDYNQIDKKTINQDDSKQRDHTKFTSENTISIIKKSDRFFVTHVTNLALCANKIFQQINEFSLVDDYSFNCYEKYLPIKFACIENRSSIIGYLPQQKD